MPEGGSGELYIGVSLAPKSGKPLLMCKSSLE